LPVKKRSTDDYRLKINTRPEMNEMFGVSREEGKEIRWRKLLLMIFDERSYFSLRKDSNGKLSTVKEKSSKQALDYFFEKAWQRPILKSHASMV
jgi:hypothetical protein